MRMNTKRCQFPLLMTSMYQSIMRHALIPLPPAGTTVITQPHMMPAQSSSPEQRIRKCTITLRVLSFALSVSFVDRHFLLCLPYISHRLLISSPVHRLPPLNHLTTLRNYSTLLRIPLLFSLVSSRPMAHSVLTGTAPGRTWESGHRCRNYYSPDPPPRE